MIVKPETKDLKFVDLGLSVKWADRNYGAKSPEDNGCYIKRSDCEMSDAESLPCRVPSKEEWQELMHECTWRFTVQNSVGGCIVTGPNGNSIFLPAAGCGFCESDGETGNYWSSTLDEKDEMYRAYYLSFDRFGCRMNSGYRGADRKSVRTVF